MVENDLISVSNKEEVRRLNCKLFRQVQLPSNCKNTSIIIFQKIFLDSYTVGTYLYMYIPCTMQYPLLCHYLCIQYKMLIFFGIQWSDVLCSKSHMLRRERSSAMQGSPAPKAAKVQAARPKVLQQPKKAFASMKKEWSRLYNAVKTVFLTWIDD